MNKCLICDSSIVQFISFGQMPIANGFLLPGQFPGEYFFELRVGFCTQCGMVQLMEQPEREKMFNENYAFFSSTSRRMGSHFKEFADYVRTGDFLSADPFVVEIGSNDGIMLKHFAEANIRHLGIEPSENVARVALDQGVNTVSQFFDEDLAKQIVAKHGQADAFLGANVMCHIPYLHSVVAGIKTLLKPGGVVMFEDPYLGDIVEKTSYDQIYDEHAFYFSVASVSYIFEQYGLEVFDVQPQSVHGGSMRYVIGHKGAHPIRPSVLKQREREEQLGLHRVDTFELLRSRIEKSRDDLIILLNDLKQAGKIVVGYAATSKSTTVINYCGIGPELVEYISDTTPIKHGKYSPGRHIPVRPHEEFELNYPDYALLFGWNHAEEIIAKEQNFGKSGGKWILYVPKVQVQE